MLALSCWKVNESGCEDGGVTVDNSIANILDPDHLECTPNPNLRSACVEGLNMPSHTLRNERPMSKNKQEHAATCLLVLRPDCYIVVIMVSGIKDG